jgi:CheY-like chemotaxis protein
MIPSSYRILLIENGTSTAETIWEMLKGSQDCTFQMVRAESLRAGLPKLASEIDALLLDIHNLERNGLAAVQEARAQFSSLPIILFIPEAKEDLGKQALAAGASAYLVKETLSPELLQKALRCVSERKRSESATRECEQRFQGLFENAKRLAHDLNNLLCVIHGHAEMLSEQLEPSSRGTKSVTQIKKAADNAASLTRKFLAFNDNQMFHSQMVVLNEIETRTENLLGRLIGERISIRQISGLVQ